MTAQNPQRRKQTAAELAKRFGKSPRTIRRIIAEPRDEYDAKVEARHEQIRTLREKGKSMRTIAAEVGVSVGTVHYALNKTAA